MTLKDFIIKYDLPGSIVLLEGKRNVPDEDKEKLIRLGELLTRVTKHILFRSGNASGADYLFSLGVTNEDPKRMEAIIPFEGHRKTTNRAYSTINLDEINLLNEPEIVLQSKTHRNTEKLVDSWISGVKNPVTKKSNLYTA